MILLPINPRHREIVVKERDDLRIQGVAISLVGIKLGYTKSQNPLPYWWREKTSAHLTRRDPRYPTVPALHAL